MAYDPEKADEAVLAPLHLCMVEVSPTTRAWKSFRWESMMRPHERGLIGDPPSKAKSVTVSAECVAKSTRLFEMLFAPAS
ncbi:MAG: hypothetical protein KAY24_10210 [Candidatus Eisenbacteria sp.]|nr:hypothetical protein [Candidatus Eisenbacteria bacterium]